MTKSFYIITIHNKEALIAKVIEGIVKSHDFSRPGEIVAVIDGCTDNTEKVIDSIKEKCPLPITKLYGADVHEIAALNHALTYIRVDANPQPNDLVFMLQDDVIFLEDNINTKLETIYGEIPDLGYVSFRLGVDNILIDNIIYDYNVVESEFGHWKQLGWTHITGKPITFLKQGDIAFRDIVVRSPSACIWRHFAKHGVFDAALCPYNYDCFDYSLRMLEAGYRNAVIGYKFESKVDWGGMRVEKDNSHNSKADRIFNNNLMYLVEKHRKFLITKVNKVKHD